VFPGNHIGSKCEIVNTIIDEFSGDSTIPNIGPHASSRGELFQRKTRNSGHSNFGVQLIGKDAKNPFRHEIGATATSTFRARE